MIQAREKKILVSYDMIIYQGAEENEKRITAHSFLEFDKDMSDEDLDFKVANHLINYYNEINRIEKQENANEMNQYEVLIDTIDIYYLTHHLKGGAKSGKEKTFETNEKK